MVSPRGKLLRSKPSPFEVISPLRFIVLEESRAKDIVDIDPLQERERGNQINSCHGVYTIEDACIVHLLRQGERLRNESHVPETEEGRVETVVVMSKSRVQILKACHSDPTAGHLGRTRTFYKL